MVADVLLVNWRFDGHSWCLRMTDCLDQTIRMFSMASAIYIVYIRMLGPYRVRNAGEYVLSAHINYPQLEQFSPKDVLKEASLIDEH